MAVNMCDWVNALPALYHEYGEESCPAPHHHQPNGIDCEWRVVPGDFYSCDSFCQIRTTFTYTMEAPVFSNPYCMGPATCSISPDDHAVYNGGSNLGNTVDIKTLKDGVSGGWRGLKQGNTASPKLTVTLKDNECGYFTFLPIAREVCGTHTWGRTINSQRKDCALDYHTEGNACNLELLGADLGRSANAWGSSIPNLKGDTIFVRTNCADHTPLPMDKQNQAYRHPGVAMPRAIREAYTSFFTQQDVLRNLATDTGKTQCGSGKDAPVSDDCIEALQQTIEKPGTTVTALNVEDSGKGYTTISKAKSCAVRVYYDDQFTASSECNVNYVEVATAGSKVLDKCFKDGNVEGQHIIRPKGKCGCHIALEKI
ncbi:hypothetical protein LTR84_004961 [Exophiala bonariae]|uniref:Uncharacterized protein n=1 Tax=Exophiala bonariae TaxID=1690606 RepID=A0AAV9NNF3_9EURO|nr:hypothetical protein LTR84_004961 [Exophiala bonariae]